MVGDVVRIPFPYAETEKEKSRPAVVLADAGRVGGRQDWILCQVTKTERQGDIAVSTDDFAHGGLPFRSWARPNVLQTLGENRILETYGRLSHAKLAEVKAAVRALFN